MLLLCFKIVRRLFGPCCDTSCRRTKRTKQPDVNEKKITSLPQSEAPRWHESKIKEVVQRRQTRWKDWAEGVTGNNSRTRVCTNGCSCHSEVLAIFFRRQPEIRAVFAVFATTCTGRACSKAIVHANHPCSGTV